MILITLLLVIAVLAEGYIIFKLHHPKDVNVNVVHQVVQQPDVKAQQDQVVAEAQAAHDAAQAQLAAAQEAANKAAEDLAAVQPVTPVAQVAPVVQEEVK